MKKILSFFLHPIWHYSPTKIAALVKADWNDELVPLAEYKKARKDFTDLATGQATVHDIAVRNGTIGIEISTELARVMAESWLDHLNQMKAENYLEFGFKLRGQVAECVVVTVQRVDGKTPHQKRIEAENKVKELEAALEVGQRNCDEVYEDLRQERDEAKKELQAVRKMVSRFLIAHRDTARCWVESFVECGAITADFNYHPRYPFIKPKGDAS